MKQYLTLNLPPHNFITRQNPTLDPDNLDVNIHGMGFRRQIFSDKFQQKGTLHGQFLDKCNPESVEIYYDSLKTIKLKNQQNILNNVTRPQKLDPVPPYREYPKRNNGDQGNYKLRMKRGRNKYLRSTRSQQEQMVYQGQIFQFDIFQRETFAELKEFLTPLMLSYKSEYHSIYVVGHLSPPYLRIPNYNRSYQRQVSYEQAQDYAYSIGAKYIEVSLYNGQNLETLMNSIAEDIIDLKLRYRRKLIEDRDTLISQQFKQLKFKSVLFAIAIIFSVITFFMLFYIMCIAFFRSKINLCETKIKDFQDIIMLPIFLSIFESLIPFIVPFRVKPRFLKVVLIGNLILFSVSLVFFVTFEVLYFDSCFYAQNFVKAFIILINSLVLLVTIFLAIIYCKIKKRFHNEYNKEINDLNDLDQRLENLHQISKKKIRVRDSEGHSRMTAIEESLIST